MLARYLLLAITAFVSGFFQSIFALEAMRTWQIPTAIGLAVFNVLLATFPRTATKGISSSLNELSSLRKIDLNLEVERDSSMLKSFEGSGIARAKRTDPSKSIDNSMN